MDWLLKSAVNGNTDAMFRIGVMYQYGKGVTKSIPTAIEWFTKAANQGNTEAQYHLGYVYKDGDEVKDHQPAVNWFQKAANNDNWLATYFVKELNEQGYYASEDKQEEKVKDETINDDDAINNVINYQNQSFTTTGNNDENANKLIDDKLKEMEKMFQSKMDLVERKHVGNSGALQNELDILKKERPKQNEEINALKEKLAKSQPGIKDPISSDFNHASSNNENNNRNDIDSNTVCTISKTDDDDINALSKLTLTEENSDTLLKELVSLKQNELEQHEENQLLKERQRRTEEGVQDDSNNDLNYDLSDNENNDTNGIHYGTDCDNGEKKEDGNNTTTNIQQRKRHYYNEDPRNLIYLD